jgi:LacI family transcriptional regulator
VLVTAKPEPAHLTSRDIAQAAGVSQATVSNVINRPHLVAPATLNRVQSVMREHGFVLNTSARNLRVGRARTIGVVALDLGNPFWGEVTRGIESTASARRYSVLLGTSEEQEEKELRFLRLFEEHRVDGIVVSSVNVGSPAIAALRARGTKVVLLDQIDPAGGVSSVAFDHVAGAALVADHLVENGHRRIGFLNGPHSVPWCRDRLEGLRRGVARHGLDPDAVIREFPVKSMTAQDAEPAIDPVLASDVTALFCVNDLVALGALKSLSQRHVPVPERLSLVGFDDSSFSSMLSPSLTTVRQHPFELGREAAELLIDAVEGQEPATVVFAPELVVRESVRRL